MMDIAIATWNHSVGVSPDPVLANGAPTTAPRTGRGSFPNLLIEETRESPGSGRGSFIGAAGSDFAAKLLS